jgi:indolepyruvate ferredoxin oxidoreductase, beta subunit
MRRDVFNIYVSGVGGQGIGMLTETLGQACLAAGHRVHGCDTHGLAQRGGTVVSHLRLGDGVFTPRVPEGEAHLVIALERLEALRGTQTHLRDGGTVLYYDAVYQPIAVRMGAAPYPAADALDAAVATRNGTAHRVFIDGLEDPRMQNSALLGVLAALSLIPDVDLSRAEAAIRAAVPPAAVDANLAVFRKAAGV